jgi:hypothetical protein
MVEIDDSPVRNSQGEELVGEMCV